MVSQGVYVLLDFHPTSDSIDPNVADPALFAANWGGLWGALKQLPGYEANVKGRVVADLINEARWGVRFDAEFSQTRGWGERLDRLVGNAVRAP